MGEYSDMDARIRQRQVAQMRATAAEMDRVAHEARIQAEACGEEARRWRLLARAAERDLIERLDAEATAATAADQEDAEAGYARLMAAIQGSAYAETAEGYVDLSDREYETFDRLAADSGIDLEWPEPDGGDR